MNENDTKLGVELELVGRRWSILKMLSKKECHVKELADELHKSAPEISLNLKELLELGLVESVRKDGKRRGGYRIAVKAKKIVDAMNKAYKEEAKSDLESWRIDKLIGILEDPRLGMDVRLSYAKTFNEACREHPTEMVNSQIVRQLIEKIAANPFRNKLTESIAGSVPYIVQCSLQHGEKENWVMETLYPIFLKNVESGNDEVKHWAIKEIGRVAGWGNDLIKVDVRNTLLRTWFSAAVDSKSKIQQTVRDLLAALPSQELFRELQAKARDPKPKIKAKAESLLKELSCCLLQNPRVQPNADACNSGKYIVSH
jgi:DNA-binding MarR family transcriptional regulator